ncbi:MAG TPA: lytic transglycosylase domain-containing protein [Acidothermaceae bacterium]
MGVFLAAAPWAFVLFAPMSEGASSPALAAQASASPSPPDYPPLLVVPLDPAAVNNGGGAPGSSSGVVVSSAGPASPPPQWLVNSQLRQAASAVGPAPLVAPAVLDSLKATGIPRRVLASYISAAATEDRLSPTCGLSWQVLAGIGFIESGHAHSGGSHNPNWSGIADPPIYGPLLDGQNGIALIPDSDQGVLDGNATYDRAVGPMQFLPSTWREYEVGASGHSAPNPQNIDDATLSAARYLCATGPDLRTPDGLIAAVYSYNHSFDYVTAVLSVAIRYAGGNLPGGASALAELPALAQTAADLPAAVAPPVAAVPSPTPSSLPYPSPLPTPPSSPLPSQYPTYAPPPVVATSAPASPLSSSPPISAPASATPTADPTPTASPDPSPSPTGTAPASSAPDSSAPASASPSPSASPAPTSETP